MELGESVEECLRREVKEEINLEINNPQLIGVFSGKELFTTLKNGDEYFSIIIGYICFNYYGEIQPDGVEVIESNFYYISDLPDNTAPYIKEKLKKFEPKLREILRAAQ